MIFAIKVCAAINLISSLALVLSMVFALFDILEFDDPQTMRDLVLVLSLALYGSFMVGVFLFLLHTW